MNISVVIPAFNEQESIYNCILEFKNLEIVKEIIVVNNNSSDQTEVIAKQAGAKVINENKLGYGKAIITGINNSTGDFVCVCEADQTFKATDLKRLVTYLDQFDVVLGSRTSNTLIWDGAYMPNWVRWGNWFVGKLVEVLFNGPSLTDIGCTFKVMRRNVALSSLLVNLPIGSTYNQGYILFLCLNKFKVVELPVNYRSRVGESKITGKKPLKTLILGIKMIFSIFYVRISYNRRKQLQLPI
jgi:glycosyltransferase involved in cell wall biosynthesis